MDALVDQRLQEVRALRHHPVDSKRCLEERVIAHSGRARKREATKVNALCVKRSIKGRAGDIVGHGLATASHPGQRDVARRSWPLRQEHARPFFQNLGAGRLSCSGLEERAQDHDLEGRVERHVHGHQGTAASSRVEQC
eukprot:scaffold54145_cov85-Phaeocystis_antarctica.AAC.3